MILECNQSAERFEKYISRVAIVNFSIDIAKRTVRNGDKIQEIRMQRDMFGRMVGLSMDYKIDIEKILSFPIIPLPMPMSRLDGSKYQTQKSLITQILEQDHHCCENVLYHILLM